MSAPKLVECVFIDGPLRGTYKYMDESILLCNRTYRHLEPMMYSERRIHVEDLKNCVEVKCYEVHYVPYRLPPNLSQQSRYAMLVESRT